MSTGRSSDYPDFAICDDDGRGSVVEYPDIPMYRVGDSVYWVHRDAGGSKTRKGPYLVGIVKPGRKYALYGVNGNLVDGGAEVEEDNLEGGGSSK